MAREAFFQDLTRDTIRIQSRNTKKTNTAKNSGSDPGAPAVGNSRNCGARNNGSIARPRARGRQFHSRARVKMKMKSRKTIKPTTAQNSQGISPVFPIVAIPMPTRRQLATSSKVTRPVRSEERRVGKDG